MRRKNFADFKHDMERWSVPAINMVYADTSGDIAWIVAGQSPIRRNWDGLTPVPGDGRFEWDGFYTAKELPYLLNPEAGFFATANEMNLPDDWQHEEMQVGYEWYDGARATRLAEVFAATTTHSIATSQALQTDIVSMPARRAMALVAALSSSDPAEKKALDLSRASTARFAPTVRLRRSSRSGGQGISGPACLRLRHRTRRSGPACTG